MKTQIVRIVHLTLVLAILAAAVPAFAASPAGVVNVNTAGVDQLTLLPRVGPSVASRIVEHREQNGKFKALEDLLLVRGIGEATLAQLEPYVAFAGETTLKEKVRPTKPAAAGDEG